MKRVIASALAGLAALAALAVSAAAQEVPAWPPGKIDVFVSAHTLTAPSTFGVVPPVVNKQENFFQQGAGVRFLATAVDLKTHKSLTGTDVKYAYVTIPGQPNLKLKWAKQGAGANAPFAFEATWSIPLDYPVGVVAFRILVKTNAHRYGSFQQVPVAAAALTVITKA